MSPQSPHSGHEGASHAGLLGRLRHQSAPFHDWLSHEWGILTSFVVALFLFLVLFSYDPRDPGFFSSGSGGVIHNWGDATGAWFSSFLLFMFGALAYFVPFGVALVGWVVFRIRQAEQLDVHQLLVSAGSLLLLLSSGAGLSALYLDGNDWLVPLPYSGGGMWGHVLAQFFISIMDRLATTLLLLLLFLLAFSWMLGTTWIQIIDLTGELLWLSWRWSYVNWHQRWKPGLLQGGDWLVAKYQSWRAGERVWPTREELLSWSAEQWSSAVAMARARLSADRGVLERPVGEGFTQGSIPGRVHALAPAPGLGEMEVAVEATPQPPKRDAVAPVLPVVVQGEDELRLGEVERLLAPTQREQVQTPVMDETQAAPQPKPVQQVVEARMAEVVVPRVACLPAVDLLDPVPQKVQRMDMEQLQQLGALLEQTLKEYNIQAQVMSIVPGPVVTLFELQPAPGVRVGQIQNLARDLARSLSVLAVRVVDIIPGKSYIGIEVPNSVREPISFREMIASEVYQSNQCILPLVLGKDTTGQPTVADLAKMPHLLVAGQTGAGKSVGVNAMIVSLLYHATADEVKFIMIDPKMLELKVYEDIPHLLAPVVTDMSEAANALRWCVVEMERRYQLMSRLGVRNIAGYNEKVKAAIERGEPLADPLSVVAPTSTMELAPPPKTLEPLPYIVVIVDEFADMFMVVGKKVEELIARLAQKARAAGIHLILATQRPSVDVVTGLIKANIPARLSFQVASKIDSRTILDKMGAEQLLGRGDMLYLGNGMSEPQRVHGPFVSDDEVHRVAAFLKTQGVPSYQDLDPASALGGSGATAGSAALSGLFEEMGGDAEKDPLYDEAVAFVMEARRVSTSSVQRRFKIGYNRAARIVDAMEAAGLVSPQQPNGNRELLLPDHG